MQVRRRSPQVTTGPPAVVLAVLIAVLTGCLAGGSTAAGTARPPHVPTSARGAPVTAVLALTGNAPVAGPGVAVLAHLGGIGAEVVRAAPATLRTLRRDARVAGLRTDAPVRTSTASVDSSGTGVFPWQRLGAQAGRPEAGREVTVAVVDTGIADTPALNRASGRLVDGVDTSGLAAGGLSTGHEVDTEGVFSDGFGHGTFMADLLAGGAVPGVDTGADRGLGVAPGARVVSVKVADDGGVTSLSAVLAGLDWVASHRPIDVVSLSLAADRPGGAYGADPLTMAVRHLRHAGVSVVVAAGNTAGEVADPGFEPQALTVGAADTTDEAPSVAPFSGAGMVHGVQKPDLVAAGVHLQSLLPADSEIARSYPTAQLPSGLWRGSGTSQATAVTAGVVAMYLGAHPGASPAAVSAAMRGAAAPMADSRAGAGMLAVPGSADVPDVDVGTLDRQAWWADGWDAPGWVQALNAAWSTDVWTATSGSSKPWSAKSWSAKSWSAEPWDDGVTGR